VLDGYHFDATYQAAISRSGWKLLAIDDFGALENYTADIIVNQDTFADERLYAHRAAHTRLLLGTDYTFLRREFRRQPRPERKATAVARRLLLTFGGSDPGRLTEMALVALECVTIDGLEAVILVGPSNPRWEQLQAATASRSNIRLLRNPPDIPQWMAWCDMAVTAAGGTLWELAYCRVPSIVVLTSEEQAPATDILQRRETCQSLGLGNRLSPGQLAAAIASLCGDPQRRSALAANLGAMVDGQGADRVLAAMQAAGADR
jgi:spore coat polysaccharide biosynthesis predicted glycosyltransferase SpsG